MDLRESIVQPDRVARSKLTYQLGIIRKKAFDKLFPGFSRHPLRPNHVPVEVFFGQSF